VGLSFNIEKIKDASATYTAEQVQELFARNLVATVRAAKESGHNMGKKQTTTPPPAPPHKGVLARAWALAKRAVQAVVQATRGAGKPKTEKKENTRKKRKPKHTQGDMCGRRVWHNGTWVLAKNAVRRMRQKKSKIKLRRKAGANARVHVLYTQNNSSRPRSTSGNEDETRYQAVDDGGATVHTTAHRRHLRKFKRLTPGQFTVADATGRRTSAVGVGEMHLLTPTTEGDSLLLVLKQVYYMPGFASVVSSRKLRKENNLHYHATPEGPGVYKTKSGVVIKTVTRNELDWIEGQTIQDTATVEMGQTLQVTKERVTIPSGTAHGNEHTESVREGEVLVQDMHRDQFEKLVQNKTTEELVMGMLPQGCYEGTRRYCIAAELSHRKHYLVSTNNWSHFQYLHATMGHRSVRSTALFAKWSEIQFRDKLTREYIARQVRNCVPCVISKMAKAPTPSGETTKGEIQHLGEDYSPFSHMSTDVCGPFNPASTKDGYRFLVGFRDRHSSHSTVIPVTRLAHVHRATEEYLSYVNNTLKGKIKTIHIHREGLRSPATGLTLKTDSASYYTSADFQRMVQKASGGSARVVHSAPHNQQCNAHVERMWGTVMRSAAAMRAQTNLAKGFWAWSAVHACRLMNLMPTESNPGGVSPHHRLHGTHPGSKELKTIRLFGAACYTKVNVRKSKLHGKARHGIYVGWSERRSCHMVYVPSKRYSSAKLLHSASVHFDQDLPKAVGRQTINKTLPHMRVDPAGDVQPNITLERSELEQVVTNSGAECLREQLQRQAVPDSPTREVEQSFEELRDRIRTGDVEEEEEENKDATAEGGPPSRVGARTPDELDDALADETPESAAEDCTTEPANTLRRSKRSRKAPTPCQSNTDNDRPRYLDRPTQQVLEKQAENEGGDKHTVDVDAMRAEKEEEEMRINGEVVAMIVQNRACAVGADTQIREYNVGELAKLNQVVNKVYKIG